MMRLGSSRFAAFRAPVGRNFSTRPEKFTSFIDKAKHLGAQVLFPRPMTFYPVWQHRSFWNCKLYRPNARCFCQVGTLAAIADDHTRAGVSVDISVSYLLSVSAGDSLKCTGRVLKTGKSLCFTQIDMYRNSDGKLVATGRHTKALATSKTPVKAAVSAAGS